MIALAIVASLAIGFAAPKPTFADDDSIISDVAVAPSDAPVAPGDYNRALLDVSVNGVSVGPVVVLLRNKDALVREDDLVRAGVSASKLSTLLVNGIAYVSLARLPADTSFKLDDEALTLAIMLPSSYFATSHVDLSRREAFDVEKPTKSGFFNYAAGYDSQGGTRFEGEAGVNIAHGLFDTLLRRDTQSGHFVGDNTSFTYDHPATGRRDVVGVVPVTADDFAGTGGSLRLVGASISRDGPLNSALRQTAGNTLSGIAAAAATVEVYVNGVLIQRQEIPPGEFQLTNLPLQSGLNNTTILVRDVFGRTQTYGGSLYGSADVLQRGDHQYQVAFGREINDYGLDAPVRPTDGVARYDYGVTDHLTVGARAVAGTDLDNVGLNAAFTSRLGEFALAASDSSAAPFASTNVAAIIDASFVSATPAPVMVHVDPDTKRVSGDAFAAAYSYFGTLLSAGASYVYQSPLYASLAHAALADHAVSDARASLSYALGHGRSLALAYENSAYRDEGLAREISALVNTRIGRAAELTTGLGSRRYRGVTSPDIIVRLNLGLGGTVDALISSEMRDNQSERVVDIEHVPVGRYGLGYGIQENTIAGASTATVDATDFTQVGDAHLFVGGAVNGQKDAEALLSGGIAFADSRIFLTEPLLESFAVADVGVPGVGVEANGAYQGSTDGSGRLLMTNVVAYGENAVSLQSSTLPRDVTVDQTTRNFATAYRGGNTVSFDARHVRIYVGSLRVNAGTKTLVPAFGTFRIDLDGGGSLVSDLGSTGGFYFDAIAPGFYTGTAKFSGGACAVKLTIPPARTLRTDLGVITCTLSK